MGVVRFNYGMLFLDRTTPTLTLPLQGGGNSLELSIRVTQPD